MANLEQLSRQLQGSLVNPDQAAYDEARRAWNLAADQRPAAVVFPETVDDVQAAVKGAVAADLRIAAQSTGHAALTLDPLDDAVLLRTERLSFVEIDPLTSRARVGAGARWGEVAAAAGAHGLAALSGSSPTVGVTGYTLGGGLGWLSRLHGLAANSVAAVELVTADGDLLRVDAEHEPDLFWALRGGGAGRFGVVTALEFDLFPLREAYGGMIAWPAEVGQELLAAYAEWTAGGLPTEMTAFFRYLSLPPIPEVPEPLRGRSVVDLTICFCGQPEQAEELLKPLRDLAGEPVLDTLGMVPAPGLARINGDPEDPVPAMTESGMLASLDGSAPASLHDLLGPDSDSPLTFFQIRHLGGALAKAPTGSGVLSHLPAQYTYTGGGMLASAEVETAILDRMSKVEAALAPQLVDRHFLNFVERPRDFADCFGAEEHSRLVEIAARYDPDGRLVSMRSGQD